jgi:hypothetical protein
LDSPPEVAVGFSVVGGRIASIDLVADPAKIHRVDVDDEWATRGFAEVRCAHIRISWPVLAWSDSRP